MVALAASAHERLFASDREVRRGGVSYMLETLRGYAADEPGSAPVLILGLDAFAELATWREPQALVAAFDIAVVTRPGYDPALIERLPGWIRTRVQPLSREAARRDKAPHQCAPGPASREGPGRIVLVPLPPIPVSATEVRERIARGESLDGLVAPEIAAYIAKYRLYWRSTAEPTET